MKKRVLRLDNISLSFGENELFANMDYEFKPGIYAFSGPSGVGKTTLMRMIAGLEKRYQGTISIEKDVEKKLDSTQPEYSLFGIDQMIVSERSIIEKPIPEIHMVHQHYKSFPWLTCINNVLMVYKGHKVRPTAKDREEALEVLDRLGIKEHAKKLPTQISGGQDQRLSLASAFVNKWSDVVLYDEPTSALDEQNDMLVVNLIREHQAKYNTIEIIITHEQHVIDALNPTIIEFTPEFRLRPSKPKKEVAENEAVQTVL
ncbi:MAG: ABC transporter ATP-binding protein [Clostridia bacterium]|nr:ABC transporter ATP-binding protein [Clostridia bacterium]